MRDWKVRSTKVDAGDFKHELLNRLKSTMAVNVLRAVYSFPEFKYTHALQCKSHIFFYIYFFQCEISLLRILLQWILPEIEVWGRGVNGFHPSVCINCALTQRMNDASQIQCLIGRKQFILCHIVTYSASATSIFHLPHILFSQFCHYKTVQSFKPETNTLRIMTHIYWFLFDHVSAWE